MSTMPFNWPTTPAEESRWDAVRESFLNDPDQIYMNTDSWGVLPRCVYEAMTAAILERELNPTRSRNRLLEGVREARARLGNFIKAPSEDLAS